MKLIKRNIYHKQIKNFKSFKKRSCHYKVIQEDGHYVAMPIKHKSKKKTINKIFKILAIILFVIGIIGVIVWACAFVYVETKPAIPIDYAADKEGYIIEDVSDVMEVGDSNATGYLIAKDADSVNDNFMQCYDFSTNTYAGSYYKQNKSSMKELADLRGEKYTEEETVHKDNYRYTLSFSENEHQILIVEKKRVIYISAKDDEALQTFEKILDDINLDK